ncbi:separin protein [Blastocladiella emersonii ATCC 22665]|nr:separin protein [Blastocladiella emersonii ATCC 22665]
MDVAAIAVRLADPAKATPALVIELREWLRDTFGPSPSMLGPPVRPRDADVVAACRIIVACFRAMAALSVGPAPAATPEALAAHHERAALVSDAYALTAGVLGAAALPKFAVEKHMSDLIVRLLDTTVVSTAVQLSVLDRFKTHLERCYADAFVARLPPNPWMLVAASNTVPLPGLVRVVASYFTARLRSLARRAQIEPLADDEARASLGDPLVWAQHGHGGLHWWLRELERTHGAEAARAQRTVCAKLLVPLAPAGSVAAWIVEWLVQSGEPLASVCTTLVRLRSPPAPLLAAAQLLERHPQFVQERLAAMSLVGDWLCASELPDDGGGLQDDVLPWLAYYFRAEYQSQLGQTVESQRPDHLLRVGSVAHGLAQRLFDQIGQTTASTNGARTGLAVHVQSGSLPRGVDAWTNDRDRGLAFAIAIAKVAADALEVYLKPQPQPQPQPQPHVPATTGRTQLAHCYELIAVIMVTRDACAGRTVFGRHWRDAMLRAVTLMLEVRAWDNLAALVQRNVRRQLAPPKSSPAAQLHSAVGDTAPASPSYAPLCSLVRSHRVFALEWRALFAAEFVGLAGHMLQHWEAITQPTGLHRAHLLLLQIAQRRGVECDRDVALVIDMLLEPLTGETRDDKEFRTELLALAYCHHAFMQNDASHLERAFALYERAIREQSLVLRDEARWHLSELEGLLNRRSMHSHLVQLHQIQLLIEQGVGRGDVLVRLALAYLALGFADHAGNCLAASLTHLAEGRGRDAWRAATAMYLIARGNTAKAAEYIDRTDGADPSATILHRIAHIQLHEAEGRGTDALLLALDTIKLAERTSATGVTVPRSLAALWFQVLAHIALRFCTAGMWRDADHFAAQGACVAREHRNDTMSSRFAAIQATIAMYRRAPAEVHCLLERLPTASPPSSSSPAAPCRSPGLPRSDSAAHLDLGPDADDWSIADVKGNVTRMLILADAALLEVGLDLPAGRCPRLQPGETSTLDATGKWVRAAHSLIERLELPHHVVTGPGSPIQLGNEQMQLRPFEVELARVRANLAFAQNNRREAERIAVSALNSLARCSGSQYPRPVHDAVAIMLAIVKPHLDRVDELALLGDSIVLLDASEVGATRNQRAFLDPQLVARLNLCREHLVSTISRAADASHPRELASMAHMLLHVHAIDLVAGFACLGETAAWSVRGLLESACHGVTARRTARVVAQVAKLPSSNPLAQPSTPFHPIDSRVVPNSWTVCQLAVDPARDALYLSVTRGPHHASLQLSLLRTVSRNQSPSEAISYATVRERFDSVVAANDAMLGSDHPLREDASQWWNVQRTLDHDLLRVLATIDHDWLGCFRGLLAGAGAQILRDAVRDFMRALADFVEPARQPSNDSSASFVLPVLVVEAWLSLAIVPATPDPHFSTSSDSHALAPTKADLEDMACFILDECARQGFGVATVGREVAGDVEFDSLVAFLEAKLRSLRHKYQGSPSLPAAGDHTVLILDAHLHAFPWESTAALRGRSVARVSSIDMLHGLLTAAGKHGGAVADRESVYYVIDPSANIACTRATFEPILRSQSAWRGTIGAPPSSTAEFISSLAVHDVFLYSGHGGGESVCSPKRLIEPLLTRDASGGDRGRAPLVAFLMGCSSGKLTAPGTFDPLGTPLDYLFVMLASRGGCVVGNLWDVTDRDNDQLAVETLRRWGLFRSAAFDEGNRVSLPMAVAAARNCGRGSFLTSAALVVYGIPVRLAHASAERRDFVDIRDTMDIAAIAVRLADPTKATPELVLELRKWLRSALSFPPSMLGPPARPRDVDVVAACRVVVACFRAMAALSVGPASTATPETLDERATAVSDAFTMTTGALEAAALPKFAVEKHMSDLIVRWIDTTLVPAAVKLAVLDRFKTHLESNLDTPTRSPPGFRPILPVALWVVNWLLLEQHPQFAQERLAVVPLVIDWLCANNSVDDDHGVLSWLSNQDHELWRRRSGTDPPCPVQLAIRLAVAHGALVASSGPFTTDAGLAMGRVINCLREYNQFEQADSAGTSRMRPSRSQIATILRVGCRYVRVTTRITNAFGSAAPNDLGGESLVVVHDSISMLVARLAPHVGVLPSVGRSLVDWIMYLAQLLDSQRVSSNFTPNLALVHRNFTTIYAIYLHSLDDSQQLDCLLRRTRDDRRFAPCAVSAVCIELARHYEFVADVSVAKNEHSARGQAWDEAMLRAVTLLLNARAWGDLAALIARNVHRQLAPYTTLPAAHEPCTPRSTSPKFRPLCFLDAITQPTGLHRAHLLLSQIAQRRGVECDRDVAPAIDVLIEPSTDDGPEEILHTELLALAYCYRAVSQNDASDLATAFVLFERAVRGRSLVLRDEIRWHLRELERLFDGQSMHSYLVQLHQIQLLIEEGVERGDVLVRLALAHLALGYADRAGNCLAASSSYLPADHGCDAWRAAHAMYSVAIGDLAKAAEYLALTGNIDPSATILHRLARIQLLEAEGRGTDALLLALETMELAQCTGGIGPVSLRFELYAQTAALCCIAGMWQDAELYAAQGACTAREYENATMRSAMRYRFATIQATIAVYRREPNKVRDLLEQCPAASPPPSLAPAALNRPPGIPRSDSTAHLKLEFDADDTSTADTAGLNIEENVSRMLVLADAALLEAGLDLAAGRRPRPQPGETSTLDVAGKWVRAAQSLIERLEPRYHATSLFAAVQQLPPSPRLQRFLDADSTGAAQHAAPTAASSALPTQNGNKQVQPRLLEVELARVRANLALAQGNRREAERIAVSALNSLPRCSGSQYPRLVHDAVAIMLAIVKPHLDRVDEVALLGDSIVLLDASEVGATRNQRAFLDPQLVARLNLCREHLVSTISRAADASHPRELASMAHMLLHVHAIDLVAGFACLGETAAWSVRGLLESSCHGVMARRLARVLARKLGLSSLAPSSPTAAPLNDTTRNTSALLYRSPFDATGLSVHRIDARVPDKWTVCQLAVDPARNVMYVSVSRGSHHVALRLSMLRTAALTQSPSDAVCYETIRARLDTVVATNNALLDSGHPPRKNTFQWWSELRAIDRELFHVIETIDQKWLGCFRGMLGGAGAQVPRDAVRDFARDLGAFVESARLSGNDANAPFTLPLLVVETWLSLVLVPAAPNPRAPTSSASNASPLTKADLKDMACFILDECARQGFGVATVDREVAGDVEFDALVAFLQVELDTLRRRYQVPQPSPPASNDHTILILDAHLHAFPWETTAALRGQSVSRVFSLEMLHGMLATAANHGGALADRGSVYYVLDPSQSFLTTQAMFEPILRSWPNWHGTISVRPLSLSPSEFAASLAAHDLFLYFGHGGGESLCPLTKLVDQLLARDALVGDRGRAPLVAFLTGCSSGKLEASGTFEPNGTPLRYLLAMLGSRGGCVVGTLWDVIDREIDRFTIAALRRWGLFPSALSGEQVSLPVAVAKSRNDCQLLFLTGAAPVVYGLPVHLSKTPA